MGLNQGIWEILFHIETVFLLEIISILMLLYYVDKSAFKTFNLFSPVIFQRDSAKLKSSLVLKWPSPRAVSRTTSPPNFYTNTPDLWTQGIETRWPPPSHHHGWVHRQL